MDLLEILGLFTLVVGAGFVIAAAALVSVTLAVLASGLFLLFAGVVVVYLANLRAAQAKATT